MRRACNVLLVLLIIAILGVAAAYAIWVSRTQHDLEVQLATLRSQGQPLSSLDLNASYPSLPAGENAADFVVAALAKTVDPGPERPQDTCARIESLLGGGGVDVVEPDEPLPAKARAVLDTLVAANGEALLLLHKAGQCEHARYPTSVDTGITDRAEHLRSRPSLQHCGYLLCAECLVAIEDGDATRAEEAMLAVLRIGDSLSDESLLKSHHHSHMLRTNAVSLLNRFLHRDSLDDATLQRLSRALEASEQRNGLRQPLLEGRCQFLQLCALVKTDPWNPARPRSEWAIYWFPGLLEYDEAPVLRLYAEAIDAADLPCSQALQQTEAAYARAEAAQFVKHSPSLLYGNVPLGLLQRRLNTVRKLRCARTALTVERYRLKEGKLPDTLDALVPAYLEAVPQDSYREERLRYERTETGYRIFGEPYTGKREITASAASFEMRR